VESAEFFRFASIRAKETIMKHLRLRLVADEDTSNTFRRTRVFRTGFFGSNVHNPDSLLAIRGSVVGTPVAWLSRLSDSHPARDHNESAEMTSPPLAVLSPRQVLMLMVFLKNLTLPSHIAALTPPEW
jgi:hypothetical protein